MKLASLALVGSLVACGSSAPPPAEPTPPAPAAGELLPWLTGDRQLGMPAGGHLTFVGHRGAKYGVWLGDDGAARVWIFDETSGDDPRPRVWDVRLAPGHEPMVVELAPVQIEANLAMWSTAAESATLALRVNEAGALVGAAPPGLQWEMSLVGPGEEAAEIAALEALFYKDSTDRGGAAWADWFAPEGGELNDAGLVAGNAAVGAAMTPVLEAVKLDWAPITTRVRGDVAFAVGGFTVTDRKTGAAAGGGSYCTVWRKDAATGWKVWFDGGRPE
ncbi:MAG: DUF4440 domain-containing protein [Myxococcales bacterium]|nr:DUF4440 domain-containing protein [Myxococcales bacterium]MBK7193049.1 DUF4440 domain-containing protein [Myxococcales bacterium]